MWFRAAIALPVIAVIGMVTMGTLPMVFGLAFLASAAPALYLLWIRAGRRETDQDSKPDTPEIEHSHMTPYAESIVDVIPDVLVLVDQKLRVKEANNAARKLFGVRLIDRDFSQILRNPDAVATMEKALEVGSAQTGEVMLLSPVERHFELIALPMPARPGDEGDDSRHAMTIALHEVTALKRAEQMRADFVANASHELRTPLASLIGFIETLQGPAQTDPEARDRFLSIMGDESARMARLIDDLLSLSRIELDEHVSPSGTVDIRHAIAASAKSLSLKAEQRGMTVSLLLDDDLPLVIGDQDQLNQVFQNLIDNAIKYGREGSQVRISAKPVERLATVGGPGLAISVHNEGEAIEREHLPRLTDRFYRVDAARSRSLGGTGLGLAIVKHIINRHRGQLAFESSQDRGTEVTVSVPVANG